MKIKNFNNFLKESYSINEYVFDKSFSDSEYYIKLLNSLDTEFIEDSLNEAKDLGAEIQIYKDINKGSLYDFEKIKDFNITIIIKVIYNKISFDYSTLSRNDFNKALSDFKIINTCLKENKDRCLDIGMKLVTDNVEIGRNDITYYSSFSYSLDNDRVRKYYNEWKNKINDNLKKIQLQINETCKDKEFQNSVMGILDLLDDDTPEISFNDLGDDIGIIDIGVILDGDIFLVGRYNKNTKDYNIDKEELNDFNKKSIMKFYNSNNETY